MLSATNSQGIVREFHIVWRVVTLKMPFVLIVKDIYTSIHLETSFEIVTMK